MYRRFIIFVLALTCLMSVGSCIDNSIWSLYSHNELAQGENFNVNDYVITLATTELNADGTTYTLLVQYKNDKTGDVGSQYMTLGSDLYFNNNTSLINYPTQFVGKHYLNAYTLDTPKISTVALFDRRYENDSIEVSIVMKNDGMKATDITTEIVLPENYEVSENTLFDDETLDKSESMQSIIILAKEREGMAHFELDTTYKFVNPATNEEQEETMVRTIDVFENNTTLVQECSLDDDEVYDRYSFHSSRRDESNSTDSGDTTNNSDPIVVTDTSETQTPVEPHTEVIVGNDEEIVETPIEETTIPDIPPTPPAEPQFEVTRPEATNIPVTTEPTESPADNKMMQVAGVVVITLFGILLIRKPNKRKPKHAPEQLEQSEKSTYTNQIDPTSLDEEEEEEDEGTFSWVRSD